MTRFMWCACCQQGVAAPLAVTKCEDCGTVLIPQGRPPEWTPAPRIYRIIRFRQGSNPRTIRSNVTLTEAQAHCSREDTHGFFRGARWFDGYDYMKGCSPEED